MLSSTVSGNGAKEKLQLYFAPHALSECLEQAGEDIVTLASSRSIYYSLNTRLSRFFVTADSVFMPALLFLFSGKPKDQKPL